MCDALQCLRLCDQFEEDLPLQIEIMAPRIYPRAVKQQDMPLNNKTMITPDERAELGNWIEHGANIN